MILSVIRQDAMLIFWDKKDPLVRACLKIVLKHLTICSEIPTYGVANLLQII